MPEPSYAVGEGHGIDFALRFNNSNVFIVGFGAVLNDVEITLGRATTDLPVVLQTLCPNFQLSFAEISNSSY